MKDVFTDRECSPCAKQREVDGRSQDDNRDRESKHSEGHSRRREGSRHKEDSKHGRHKEHSRHSRHKETNSRPDVESVKLDPYLGQGGLPDEESYREAARIAFRKKQDAERAEAEQHAKQYRPPADPRRAVGEREKDRYEKGREQRLRSEWEDREYQEKRVNDRVGNWDNGDPAKQLRRERRRKQI